MGFNGVCFLSQSAPYYKFNAIDSNNIFYDPTNITNNIFNISQRTIFYNNTFSNNFAFYSGSAISIRDAPNRNTYRDYPYYWNSYHCRGNY